MELSSHWLCGFTSLVAAVGYCGSNSTRTMGKRKTRSQKGFDADSDSYLTDATMLHQAIPAPTFDGTTDVEVFLQQFNAIADHNRWGATERRLRLRIALKGTATRGIDGETYAIMCEQLHKQYALTEEVASKLLKDIKRERHENVSQFSQRVTQLVRKVYPELSATQQEQQVKRELISTVPQGSQLAWTLRLTPPGSLEELVDAISKYETFSGQKGYINRMETEEATALKDQIAKQAADQLASQEAMLRQFTAMQSKLMEQMMTTQKQMVEVQKEVLTSLHSKHSSRQELRCYNCQGKGHYARNCKKPKKESGNDKVQAS